MQIDLSRSAPRRRSALLAWILPALLLIPFDDATAKRAVPAPGKAAAVQEVPVPLLAEERSGDWRLWRDIRTGLVRRVSPVGDAHAPAVPAKGLSAALSAPMHLERAAAVLGLDEVLEELEIEWMKRGLATTHAVYRRVIDGVPVEPGRVAVHMDREGRLLCADGVLDPRHSSAGLMGKSASAVDREEAIRAAASGPEGRVEPVRAELVYRETDEGLRLFWKVRYVSREPIAEWEVWIDAVRGVETERIDRTVRATGTGTIWSPNPVNALGRTDLYDMDDADQDVFNGAYQTVQLLDLDPPVGGMYRLSGPYVVIDDFEPDFDGDTTIWIPEVADPNDFQTTRADPLFEAVMAYYHIDKVQRYLRRIGFDGVAADSLVVSPIPVDPHGVDGEDNSHYLYLTHQLAYGDGCVDDAEDADVIVHEYGHAIEYSQVPNWGYPGGYMGPMAEGFSDYWAESHAARSGVSFDLGQVFDWDRGPMDGCWPGRRVDNDKTVADLILTNGVPNRNYYYDNSLVWSGTLWDIHQSIGGGAADSVILESHFFLNGTSPLSTFEDGAFGLLRADKELTGWRNGLAIYDALAGRGILHAANTPQPALLSAAVEETLFGGGALPCTLVVDTGVPLRGACVIYGDREAAGDTIDLAESVPASGVWTGSAMLAGAESIFYFYKTEDAAGRFKTLPAGAPTNAYKVVVGIDVTPPVIVHTPIVDVYDSALPAALSATITDNFGVDPDSAVVEYVFTGGAGSTPDSGSFLLVCRQSDSVWVGEFPGGQGVYGTYEYRIRAADLSEAANRTVDPAAGVHSFTILRDLTAPSVVHAPLPDRREGGDSPSVEAVITDNGALNPDSLLLEYGFLGVRKNDFGTVLLESKGGDLYSASFPAFPESVGVVEYRIRAVDKSIAGNGVYEPAAGYNRFEIYPASIRLAVLGPVPFRDRIDFALLQTGEGPVRFEVYDVAGRRVRTVHDGVLDRGAHLLTWDGRTGSGREAAQGIYLYRLETSGYETSGRVVLVR